MPPNAAFSQLVRSGRAAFKAGAYTLDLLGETDPRALEDAARERSAGSRAAHGRSGRPSPRGGALSDGAGRAHRSDADAPDLPAAAQAPAPGGTTASGRTSCSAPPGCDWCGSRWPQFPPRARRVRRAGLAMWGICRSFVRADEGTRTPDPLLTMETPGAAPGAALSGVPNRQSPFPSGLPTAFGRDRLWLGGLADPARLPSDSGRFGPNLRSWGHR
jgi:hypothetical protein